MVASPLFLKVSIDIRRHLQKKTSQEDKMIRVNINVLNKKVGDIVREGDKWFEQFRAWAVRGDLKQGVVICNFTHGESTEKHRETEPEAPAVEKEARREKKKTKKLKHPNFMQMQDMIAELIEVFGVNPPDKLKRKELIQLLLDTRKDAEV